MIAVVAVVVLADMDAKNNTGHSNMVGFLLCPTGALFVVVAAGGGAMVWMVVFLLVTIMAPTWLFAQNASLVHLHDGARYSLLQK